MRLAFKPMKFLIIDSHEDIAHNIISLGRDYTHSAHDIRKSEAKTDIPVAAGNALLGWPEYQAGNIAIVFGTLFCGPARLSKSPIKKGTYNTPEEAHICYRENLDAYRKLADDHPDKFRLIFSAADLQNHWQQWQAHLDAPGEVPPPVGIVILMEGAEGVREPAEVERWAEWGVRLIGPAWAGNQYVGGTREPGPLTKAGYALLDHMAACGLILDISHMDHQSARQALDVYPGQVIASHSNAEALIRDVNTNRHLKDETIQQLIERDGVMGIIPYNTFLDTEWKTRGGRESIGLEMVADQIDHVCQLAGNTRHVALGTDFDGGFGVEAVPHEIDTIADLVKLVPQLTKKGYNQDDIAQILSGNWFRILQENLPES